MDLLSRTIYKMNWEAVILFYHRYNSVYSITSFKDLFFLLDRKLNIFLEEYFGLMNFEISNMLSNKLLEINNLNMVSADAVIENGFIIKFKNLFNSILLYETKIFYTFFALSMQFYKKNNLNNFYFFIKFKKLFIENLYLNNLITKSISTVYTKNYINCIPAYKTSFSI